MKKKTNISYICVKQYTEVCWALSCYADLLVKEGLKISEREVMSYSLYP